MYVIRRFVCRKFLGRARCEYDSTSKDWWFWVALLPGMYVQVKAVEDARAQLAEVSEGYILVSVRRGRTLPGFQKIVAGRKRG